MKSCFVPQAVNTSFFVVLLAHIISSHVAFYHVVTAKILLAMILWFYLLKKWHSGVHSVYVKLCYVFTSTESGYVSVRGEGWRQLVRNSRTVTIGDTQTTWQYGCAKLCGRDKSCENRGWHELAGKSDLRQCVHWCRSDIHHVNCWSEFGVDIQSVTVKMVHWLCSGSWTMWFKGIGTGCGRKQLWQKAFDAWFGNRVWWQLCCIIRGGMILARKALGGHLLLTINYCY